MAKKTKAQKLEEFEAHVNKLAFEHGLTPTNLAMSQILDLGSDISDERPENIFVLIMQSVAEIQKLWDTYGAKPNVLVDVKLKNVRMSIQNVSPEYQMMFWINVFKNGVRWKNMPTDLGDEVNSVFEATE